MPNRWFDAHLDLAYMEAAGRRMDLDPSIAGGPDLPAAVTLTSLAAGGVESCLATIFVEPDGTPESISYPSGDAEAAYQVGWHQIAIYQRWAREGRIALGTFGAAKRSEPFGSGMRVGILIEGADPIRTPAEVQSWVDAGVVAVGLAWAKPSRYAGGNMTSMPISSQGRELVKELDRCGVVHDASHLSDAAFQDLCALTDQVIIASHSNARTLIHDGREDEAGVPAFQRHLRDEQIREITRRGGVVGINLFSPFLIRGGIRERRATVEEWCDHVERICDLAGGRHAVGLGSDMDGGFSAHKMPQGIDRPEQLDVLSQALAKRGFTDQDLESFRRGNWMRFWEKQTALTASRGVSRG